MTVKDLLQLLGKADPNAKIWVVGVDGGGYEWCWCTQACLSQDPSAVYLRGYEYPWEPRDVEKDQAVLGII